MPDGHRGARSIRPGRLPGSSWRIGRLLVFMPHGFQQFFAFVLSDFAAAFFSQIAHVEDSWLKVSLLEKNIAKNIASNPELASGKRFFIARDRFF